MEKLNPLKPNDEIVFISTARKVNQEELNEAIEVFESWGLKVTFSKNIFKEHNQFAGTDNERAEDLQWALDHPTAKAIMCTRGGYGTSRLIDLLNFETFKKKPKWVIGFSDVTILHQEINRLGFPSIHGTMPILFSNKIAVQSLKESLFNDSYSITTKSNHQNKLGNTSGKIVGGNLTLLIHTLSTPSEINTEGKILFIEEIDEYLYHIDRMLLQLKRAGKLAHLKALLVGGFSDLNDNTIPFGKTVEQIILEHTATYNYPIWFDFPSGHIDENKAIILEQESKLEISSERCQLTFIR